MIDNIITLIIAEAKARDTVPLPGAFREIMLTIQTVLEAKIADLVRLT